MNNTNKHSMGEIKNHPCHVIDHKVLGGCVTVFDICGAFVVLGLMIVVNLDVFGRWLFNSPFHGTLELSEMGIVAIVYFQIARTIRNKRLTRADTLFMFLKRHNRARLELLLRAVFNFCGALVFAIICTGQYPRLIASWEGGYFKGNVGVFVAPLWPLELVILIGSFFACIQFIFLGIQNVRSIQAGELGKEGS